MKSLIGIIVFHMLCNVCFIRTSGKFNVSDQHQMSQYDVEKKLDVDQGIITLPVRDDGKKVNFLLEIQ